jgi:hypothetical protein
MNSDYSITSMNFHRWLIKGSFAPSLIRSLFVCYIGCIDNIFDEHQPLYIIAIILKVPLFFVMRYAESQPDFFLNNLETSIVTM